MWLNVLRMIPAHSYPVADKGIIMKIGVIVSYWRFHYFRSMWLLFATGASWLCYYKALQMGEASKVVPVDKLCVILTLILAFVFLHEQFTIKSLIGCVLIGVGTFLMI